MPGVGVKTFKRKDLAGKADKQDEALVIIDDKVYDVTDFVPEHPGGEVILTHINGEDATGSPFEN
jgi:cytochrome b involved in lipid metabolism